MAILANFVTKVITVQRSSLTLISGVSYSLNTNAFRLALKDLEASEEGQVWPVIHKHNTEVLLGGITYARMLEILAPYTVTFEEVGTPYVVSLVGSNNNILDRANLGTVQVLSNNSAGLVNLLTVEQATESMKYQIESLRRSHNGVGSVFFVSINGNDSATGLLPTTPKLTIAGALADCVSGRGDVINLLSPGAGQAVYTGTVVVDKEDVHIRGVGRGTLLQPTAGVPITLNADNCSVSSLFIKTAAGSSDDGIVVNGKFSRIEDLYIAGPDTGGATPVGTGNGIHFRGGDYHEVIACVIEKFGADGVRFTDAGLSSGSPREVVFDGNQVYFNRQHGVNFTGTSAVSSRLNLLLNNKIFRNSGYGVYVGLNTQRHMIDATNFIKGNGAYPSGAGGTEIFYAEDATTNALIDNMAATMPSAIWAKVLETMTAEEMMRVMMAALSGKREGMGTALEKYMGRDGVTPRITLAPDAAGNGTPVVSGAP